jgi:hypothetical protein
MKIFHCDHCQHLAFFENVQCVRCAHPLAFFPDMGEVGSLEAADEGRWRSPLPEAQGKRYRLCANFVQENVCNWAIPDEDPRPLCASCRLTRVIPDLTPPANRPLWYRLEVAKRRLVYGLLALGLPLTDRTSDPENGLAFEFRSDTAATAVLTGHNHGVITVNIAEADDVEREKRRVNLREPFRTLLGHFRHESGHYYWDRLVKGNAWLEKIRAAFGDERCDYAAALEQHYQHGPPADWQQWFVSAYASVHPWEDWAETWAHFLHMSDALETAAACGVSLRPHRKDEPALPKIRADARAPFDAVMENWFALTYVLNNLNRGLGHQDAYPFVLSTPAIEKLRLVHEIITSSRQPG